MKRLFAPVCLCSLFLLTACVTHIKVDETMNPAPQEAFKAFTRFEIKAITLQAPYAGNEANTKALAKIQENVSREIDPVIAGWNTAGAAKPARTLVISPRIDEIKFIGGNARFWAGPLAGSSAVILKVDIVEKETGKVIASPVFYARAAAMGGTFTIGATDNVMLIRIAGRLTDYLKANYPAAVGGMTGVDSN